MHTEAIHDVIVIGAGAAGVSAAIECFDIRLDVIVLEAADKVGGQIDQIPHAVRNVAPAPDGNDALVDALTRHASMLDDRLAFGQTVTRLDLEAGIVHVGPHHYRSRTVLMATGSRRRELENAPEGVVRRRCDVPGRAPFGPLRRPAGGGHRWWRQRHTRRPGAR